MVESALILLVGMFVGAILFDWMTCKRFFEAESLNQKHYLLFRLMMHWVAEKQKGRNLAGYLVERGHQNIAIYGMNYVGKALMDELKDTGVNVKYGIDRNADNIVADVDLHKPDEVLETVDAVVVTPFTSFDEIKKMLSKRLECPIFSIEDLVYDIRC